MINFEVSEEIDIPQPFHTDELILFPEEEGEGCLLRDASAACGHSQFAARTLFNKDRYLEDFDVVPLA